MSQNLHKVEKAEESIDNSQMNKNRKNFLKMQSKIHVEDLSNDNRKRVKAKE